MVDLLAIQMNGTQNLQLNLEKLEAQLSAARVVKDKPALAVFPECASLFGCAASDMLGVAEPIGDGPIQSAFAKMAQDYNVYLVAGTTPILDVSRDKNKYLAASLVFDPKGQRIAQYNKIHLFDVEVDDNTRAYKESNSTLSGNTLSRFSSPWGDVGQAVCYDLRFAAMFSEMMPANIVVIPSAFTKKTGEAHWHTLLSARAIEMQAYVVAPNQVGVHADKRETFGHSCIYSPWGELLSVVENGEGVASARFEPSRLNKVRQSMPLQSHKQERYRY